MSVHVVYRRLKRRWEIRIGGGYPTQAETIDAARDVAQALGTELVIHRRNGRIRAKDSHGNDPRDVRG